MGWFPLLSALCPPCPTPSHLSPQPPTPTTPPARGKVGAESRAQSFHRSLCRGRHQQLSPAALQCELSAPSRCPMCAPRRNEQTNARWRNGRALLLVVTLPHFDMNSCSPGRPESPCTLLLFSQETIVVTQGLTLLFFSEERDGVS